MIKCKEKKYTKITYKFLYALPQLYAYTYELITVIIYALLMVLDAHLTTFYIEHVCMCMCTDPKQERKKLFSHKLASYCVLYMVICANDLQKLYEISVIYFIQIQFSQRFFG